jgi:outer membrane protease
MILLLFAMGGGDSFAYEDTGLRFLVSSGNHTLSSLEWELKPAGSIGIDLQYNFGRGWFAGIGYASYPPWKTGTMEDRDWYDPVPDEPARFSSHDAFLVGGYRADVQGGYRFRSDGPVKMSLFLGYMQSYFSMDSREGYLEYPPGSDQVSVYGTIIDYFQLYLIPHAGLMMEEPLGRSSSFIFTARFTPFTICGETTTNSILLPG